MATQLTGCIPEGLRDVANSDLSLLNLPDCEAASSKLELPGDQKVVFRGGLREAYGVNGGAIMYLEGGSTA